MSQQCLELTGPGRNAMTKAVLVRRRKREDYGRFGEGVYVSSESGCTVCGHEIPGRSGFVGLTQGAGGGEFCTREDVEAMLSS